LQYHSILIQGKFKKESKLEGSSSKTRSTEMIGYDYKMVFNTVK